MPREIDSLDPVVVEASSQTTYDKLELSSVKYVNSGEISVLKVGLCNVDSEGNREPAGSGDFVNIKDVSSLMADSPRLASAWDSVVDIMGDIYVEQRLQTKLKEASAAGQDTTQLEADLSAAQAVVRAAL